MKTAIQQALAELDLVPMDKSTDYILGVLKAIKVMERYLPTEQEQIEQAYKEGCMYYSSAFPKEYYNVDAELYYTETFKNDK